MSISDLFFQSALVNALIFLWLASMVTTIRIFLGAEQKIALSFLVSALLGPAALILAWLLHAKHAASGGHGSLRKDRSSASKLGVISVTLLITSAFYGLFVLSMRTSTISSEVLLSYVTLFIVGAGLLGGVVLSIFTRRVAFYESAWTTFLCAASALFLREWAEVSFAFGTSSTYLVTIILSNTALLFIFLILGGSFGYLLFGEGRFSARFGYENFIGTRFLMTKRSSHAVSLITVISVVAVMIACGGMIVVMSVMNGFSSDLRAKILGANAHLMVLKYGKDFSEYDDIIKKTMKINGVLGASAFILNEGMVSSNKNLSGSIITGLDLTNVEQSGRLKYVSETSLDYLKHPTKIPAVYDFANPDSASAKNQLPGVILGKEMATDLQVLVGDVVNLISPIGDIGPTGPIPRAKPFRVAGMFYSGMYDFDAKFAFIALNDAQEFFNLGNNVTGVEYRVDDIENTRGIAKEIDEAIGGYPFYTRDWMQMNRNMFSALQLEKIVMLIILGTLIFMASLLILVTLIMVVMEKGKEIAILKSMGATDVSIMKIFVTYGLFVGGSGAVMGGAFGLTVCLLIEKIGIRLDPDVYYFSSLPVRIVSSEVFLVVTAAILISFLATIPPSLFAARLKPVDGLRYE